MGASWELFRTGVLLFLAGYVVSVPLPPVGRLMAEVGTLVVAGAIIWGLVRIGLALVAVVAADRTGNPTPKQSRSQQTRESTSRQQRKRDRDRTHREPTKENSQPSTRPARPDYDIDAIDDYER